MGSRIQGAECRIQCITTNWAFTHSLPHIKLLRRHRGEHPNLHWTARYFRYRHTPKIGKKCTFRLDILSTAEAHEALCKRLVIALDERPHFSLVGLGVTFWADEIGLVLRERFSAHASHDDQSVDLFTVQVTRLRQ